MRHKRLGLSALLTGAAIVAGAAETLVVSPVMGDLRTPSAAIGRVRTLRRSGALNSETVVRVRIESGVYLLTEPLVFGPEDSNLVFEGTDGAVLSGGQAASGWKPLSNGLWRASLPPHASFRQLTVNGIRAPRCRHPNVGCFKAAGEEIPFDPSGRLHSAGAGRHGALVYDPKDVDFAALAHPDEVELRVFHWWVDSHLQIGRVDAASRRVTFVHPASLYVGWHRAGNKPGLYRLENVREFLDEPGEWFYDAEGGALDYLPREGEDPSSARFQAVAARQRELVRFVADPVASGRYVRNVVFRNVTFRDADAGLGARDKTNGAQGSASVGAAFQFFGARDCRFENCRFEALDGFAADVKGGSRGVVFDRCSFHDLGAGAIRIDGGTFTDHPAAQTRGNVVRDCDIGPYGLDWASAVGILVMNSSDNEISHNHIHDGFYTGVSVGWSWGYGDSVSARNLVSFNLIENIGKGLLNDMGGIYTLGHQPGTVVRNNVVRGIRSWSYGGHCFYADEGSQGILIENNVFSDAPDIFNIHYARELTVRNNILAMGGRFLLAGGRHESHVTAYFHGNVFYYREGNVCETKWRSPKPYEFAFDPFSAPSQRTDHDVADYNLFWNPTADPKTAERQFREEGVNVHSVWADPKFVDPERGNFTMASDSPALRLGFEPIDVTDVGPQAR